MKKLMFVFVTINLLAISCVAQKVSTLTTLPSTVSPATTSTNIGSAVEQEKICSQPNENHRIETGQQVVFMQDEPLRNRFVVTFSLFAGAYYINKNDPCFSQLYEELNYSLQNQSDVEFSYQVPGSEIIYAKAIKSTATP
jgi:hypothetical protein